MNRRLDAMLVTLLVAAQALACAGAPAKTPATPSVPPPSAAGETAEDQPWAAAARAIAADAEQGLPLDASLRRHSPEVARQLERDAAHPALLRLWGRSLNFDANARQTIVLPALLGAMATTLGVPPPDGRVVHAGMEHTYGYLFSNLVTPYGFKRARWVKDHLEVGFGLPRGTLGPVPAEGTLLLNVTTFLGRIAFRDQPALLALLEKEGAAAAPAVRGLDYGALEILRVVETVEVPGEGGARTVTLRTDLVPFPKGERENAAILIYSVDDPAAGGVQLVTGFPITRQAMEGILAPSNFAESKPVKTRYNAFVPGLTDREPPLVGRCVRQ